MPPPSTDIPDRAPAGDSEGQGRERDRLVVEMVERDRLRVAGALHNSACQSLSGLQLFAATLLKRMEGGAGALSENIDELARMLRQVSTELRGVVQWLRPPPLREEGLIVSLLELAAEVSSAIPCEFHCDDRRMEVDPYVAGQLYQIAHASVLEVVQRRAAARIEIELVATPQSGLSLSVWDDRNSTQNCEPGQAPDLCNWELLHLRAQSIGGKLTVHSPESGGRRVTCLVETNATK